MGLYIDYYLDSDLINKPPLEVVAELEKRLAQKLTWYDHDLDNSKVRGWFLEDKYEIIINHVTYNAFCLKYQTKTEKWKFLYLGGTFYVREENTQFSCGESVKFIL